jgi:hypothetical protein
MVYDDALQNGFVDWSWATHNLNNNNPVSSGLNSIAMQPDNWGGVYFHNENHFNLADNNRLSFMIHGGTVGGQLIRVYFQENGNAIATTDIPALAANTWQNIVISLSDLGVTFGGFNDIIFQDRTGTDQTEIYIDEVKILDNIDPPINPTPITVNIDINQNRRPINDEIYGVNFGSTNQLNAIGYPIRRWGGNAVSRFNWKKDVSNSASDWFYFNYPATVADASQLPNGSSSDVFIQDNLNAGAQTIMTIPMMGWVARDERTRKWGFSVTKYGTQNLTECTIFQTPPAWCNPDAGNGLCDPNVNTTGYCSADGFIINNDKTDTSQTIDSTWVTDWMQHISSQLGQSAVKYWALDNEPMLWNSTHRDIHPQAATYDEIWNKTLNYAAAIKAQDANAQILGPTVWGWCAYFTSASDVEFANNSCVDGPDRQAHGGQAFMPWYLQQVCHYQQSTGIRLVDYLDIHYYPQGGVAGLSASDSAEDTATQGKRFRSLKELYHPSFIAESWINENVRMIPRLHDWIDNNCPGTKIAISEYKFGSDNGISGVLAQAEVLAIFGREGVDLATRWIAPEDNSKAENAFKLYLNYDGYGAKISGDSVQASSSNQDELGSYAIHNSSNNKLYILLFNKNMTPKEATINLGLTPFSIEVYGFNAGTDITFIESLPTNSQIISTTVPEYAARLIVVSINNDLIYQNGYE